MTTAAASYATPLLLSALALTGLLWLVWQHRQIQGASRLGLLVLAVIIYQVGYALELSSATQEWAYFWIRVEYFGIAVQPYALLGLAAVYGGNQWIETRQARVALLVIPAITLLLAWTNSAHELIWRDFHLEPYGNVYRSAFSRGAWYWVQIVYLWVTSLAALALLARAYRRVAGIYRGQTALLMAGALFPLTALVVYLAGAIPGRIDPMPFALIPSMLLLVWGVLYWKLLTIMPVARDTVFASLRDPVIVLDPRGVVVDLNPAAEHLLKRPEAETLGHAGDALVAGWFDLAALQSAGEQGQEIAIERDGETLVFHARWMAVSGRAGRPVGSLIVLNDITARKRAETERERLIAELDAFARTVAHDLKSPLAVLVPSGLTLRDEAESMSPAEIAEFAAMIAETSLKMNAIVDALLLLAQLERVQEVNVGPVNLAPVVTQALKRLDIEIREAHAQVILPGEWPLVTGYGPWLEEVFANYVSNAIKYGGEPPLITLGADCQANGAVRCWVRDNGRGLSAEQQGQLFAEFTRLHGARASGHGLGLAIVRRIIERLGGQVGVLSADGEGSEFYFILPGVPAVANQETKP